MLEQRKPIDVQEAIKRVIASPFALGTEKVSLNKAINRYLAEDIYADQDVPAFDRSPYDGFAVRSEDTEGASRETPIRLKVLDTIGAGYVAGRPLEKGEAYRIMTGAAIPEGADAIVMLELAKARVEPTGASIMEITREFPSGHNISRRGEDIQKGLKLLDKGTKITPGVIAVLATFGYHQVEVRKKPVVGVIATGSELLEPNEALRHGKIRNSNGPMILAMVEEAGGVSKYYGQLKDDLSSSIDAVENAINEVDILITTGGVSVGDFDFLPEIYQHLKADVLFNKVGMRPGSVTTVARTQQGKMLFGLSGNPSACFVGFSLFSKPFIKKVLGSDKLYSPTVEGVLGKDFPKPNPFTRFVRCQVSEHDGKLIASPVGLDKSNVVTSLALANALMVLPGGTRGYQKGDRVKLILLSGEDRDSYCL